MPVVAFGGFIMNPVGLDRCLGPKHDNGSRTGQRSGRLLREVFAASEKTVPPDRIARLLQYFDDRPGPLLIFAGIAEKNGGRRRR
jgi:hypothetical protein